MAFPHVYHKAFFLSKALEAVGRKSASLTDTNGGAMSSETTPITSLFNSASRLNDLLTHFCFFI